MQGDVIKTIKIIDKGEEGRSVKELGIWPTAWEGEDRSGSVPWDKATAVPEDVPPTKPEPPIMTMT